MFLASCNQIRDGSNRVAGSHSHSLRLRCVVVGVHCRRGGKPAEEGAVNSYPDLSYLTPRTNMRPVTSSVRWPAPRCHIWVQLASSMQKDTARIWRC